MSARAGVSGQSSPIVSVMEPLFVLGERSSHGESLSQSRLPPRPLR